MSAAVELPPIDPREIERAAVELRTRGFSQAAAAVKLAERYDAKAVEQATADAYTYNLSEGIPAHDDRAARLLAPLLALRHRYVVTPGAPEGRWAYYDAARGLWRDDSAKVELLRSIEHVAVDLADDFGIDEHEDGFVGNHNRVTRAIASKLAKAGGKAAAIRVLAPHLAIYADAFDNRADLVALTNGTLHVRGRARGRVGQHHAEHYLTTGLDLDFRPEAIDADLSWQAFGLSILDAATWRWLNLTLARWALHGHSPPWMLVLHGATRTGKTTLAETVLAVLGDLGASGSLGAFTEQATPGPNSARAALIGPRLVSISEAGRYDAISSQPFKAYTGGGSVPVEEKYQRQRTAKPSALLLLDTNILPKIDGADDAVMRRLLLVPFRRRFYSTDTEAGRAEYDAAIANGEAPGTVDADLPARLKTRASREAVLAYWVALLRTSPDADPAPPIEVQRATEAWRAQANPVSAYIDGRYTIDPRGETVLADFAVGFREWLDAYLPDRAREFRDNRQVAAALRELPPRTLRVDRVGNKNTPTVLGLRRIEAAA